MSQFPLATVAAAMVGVVGSAWVSGQILSISAITIPGILTAPAPISTQHLAAHWRIIYQRGSNQAPVRALIVSLGWAFLTYDALSRGAPWAGFAGAGVLTVGIAPFTILTFLPTNNALTDVATGKDTARSDKAVRALVRKWERLNLVRSLFPLAGAVVGLWTLLA